jgi:PAS domain S-box-containing protein
VRRLLTRHPGCQRHRAFANPTTTILALARTSIIPTGKAKAFSPDQIIVSKTDPQGRITYVNDVFIEVSEYTEDELVGAAHSIIRHPDMPRCIYKLMWQRIQAGHELFAYVVNLCKSGAHYWVYAHVTPTFGGDGTIIGYHSNRRTAHEAAVATAEGLYARLRDVEAAYSRKSDAADAGQQELNRILAQAGIPYDEFVWTL